MYTFVRTEKIINFYVTYELIIIYIGITTLMKIKIKLKYIVQLTF